MVAGGAGLERSMPAQGYSRSPHPTSSKCPPDTGSAGLRKLGTPIKMAVVGGISQFVEFLGRPKSVSY